MKRCLGYFFLAFALVSLAVAVGDLSASSHPVTTTREASQDIKEQHHTAVILFRGSGFCPTCDIMERLTLQLLNEALSPDYTSGAVTFSKINLEEPANEHFFFDYDLVTTSIVLSRREQGRESRWKNLAEGWRLAEESPDAFKKYIADEVRQFETDGGIAR